MENKIIDESKQGEALVVKSGHKGGKKMFLESYGCQMNFADSEIVASILIDKGYTTTTDYKEADLIFVNTCAIRENAESRVRQRLYDYKKVKKTNKNLLIGVLGCMAERLKHQFLEQEKLVDMVVGPDAYRDLPNLIAVAEGGQQAINVILSKEETYADISPVRLDHNGVSAFVSIMRGCDNMCSFCVVPFTRGRERSREPETIVRECKEAFDKGYREVTLLGQNVNSYLWSGGGLKKETLTEEQKANSTTFAELLEMVALIHPDLRVRYSTSHPKDMGDDVLHMMAKHENICKYVHLPVQSGNDTLSLMEEVQYEFAYMFSYSERPKTLAERKYEDDVPAEIKSRRLTEIVDMQRKHSEIRTKQGLGKTYRVLVENVSKKSAEMMSGRNTQNTVVVFPKGNLKKGDYVNVLITSCTSGTLIGECV
ncbi:MAG: tRNA ((37)-C2)-methylthiotransferase MiaB [Bacteroidota bacterium]|nr:tRNA ((37)-C2)-methylthiotransferase MiaB [Bacteroidota bacterium]